MDRHRNGGLGRPDRGDSAADRRALPSVATPAHPNRPSYELDDKSAVVAAIARVAKYLVGKEKQKALRADTSWVERASERPPAADGAKVLRFVHSPKKTYDTVPVYDLRVAAGAFSGQIPEPLEYVVDGLTPRPGHFVAQVVGDSMDELVPMGAWCLFEHLGAGTRRPATGDCLIVRRENAHDPDFGEFTFKQLVERRGRWALAPRSSRPEHQEIPMLPGDGPFSFVARFVGVARREDD